MGGWHCLVWEVFCWSHSNRLLETGVDGVATSNRCCSANNVGQYKHEPRLWLLRLIEHLYVFFSDGALCKFDVSVTDV